MHTHITIQMALAAAVAIAGAATDIAWRRVPNWITVPAALLGLIVTTALDGWPGLASSIIGLAAGLAIGVAAMLFGAPFGGGDTKLLAAIGALAGPSFLASTAIYAAFAGGLLAIAHALRHGKLKRSLKAIVTFAAASAGPTRPISLETVGTGLTIPFAVALAAGATAAAFVPPLWTLLA